MSAPAWGTLPSAYGFLRVSTSPAVPSQIVVDGVARDTWGLNWMKIDPGLHQVCFGDVAGFGTPACQNASVTDGATTTVTGTFTQHGSLHVTTSPALPSTISVDGIPRNDWGMWTDLPVGVHQVCFGVVAGYDPPACQKVTLIAGVTSTVTGTFTVNPSAPGDPIAGVITNHTSADILNPRMMTTGPDGNMWFTNANSIGRITPAGVVTKFTNPTLLDLWGITAGPDGNLWFANQGGNSIGRITPAGVITMFTDPSVVTPFGITAGPDGNVWFTNEDTGSIGRITPSGVITNYTDPGIGNPFDITAGPDGNLWFADLGGNSIGRITPAGVVTMFTDPSVATPFGITAGPDGNVWFTNQNNDSIGRITPSGVITKFTGVGISAPVAITTGPDRNVWFTNFGNNSIGQITPAGVITTYINPSVATPFGITAGLDGGLWFTNRNNNSIGRSSSVTTGLLRVLAGLPSQISVDGVPRDTWGLNWMKIGVGAHHVCYGVVAGYRRSPQECHYVNVKSGETTIDTGSFVKNVYLRVMTSPAVPATIYLNNIPMNDWGVWTDLPAGSSRTVCFGDVPGYVTPSCITFDLQVGVMATFTGAYIPE